MKHKIFVLLTLVVFLGLGAFWYSKNQPHEAQMASSSPLPKEVVEDFYTSQVQSIFSARCVACHACYNAPCQMNLTSYSGFKRGASKDNPYDFPLVNEKPPSRLDVDAKSEQEWRQRGFYSVEERAWFLKLILMKNTNSDPHQKYEAESSRTCPDPKLLKETNRFSFDKAFAGMPYGLPKLASAQQETLSRWISMGSPGPSAAAESWFKNPQAPGLKEEIKAWETRLNGSSLKERLSARYFYEHLFIAHIYFQSSQQEFFRIVRAKNAEGYPDEIATVRPFDDAKQVFYYRFIKIDGAIVSKTHTTFELSADIQRQYNENFLGGNWGQDLKMMPPYGIAGANAFVTFSAIPRKIRYEFFLSNARYFIMTFMKGPVCRGQTALNVINDHFWVMFMDPATDVSTLDNAYFQKIENLMDAPATTSSKPFDFRKLRQARWKANRRKLQYYRDNNIGLNLESIWNGGAKSDRNALLTVYRHFDSADVRFGAEGDIPKTVWVIDYQIFEDIYYNLVAGYNVYGPLKHQVESRLYMELSRISSEDMFLTFLPQNQREIVREQWSHESTKSLEARATDTMLGWVGIDVETKMKEDYKYIGQTIRTDVQYKSYDGKLEFLQQLFSTRLAGQISAWPDSINRRSLLPETGSDTAAIRIAKKFAPILGKAAKYVAAFPDSALVKVNGKDGKPYVYTLIHNKEHSNVNLMMFESLRREPNKDTLILVPGYATSYPNFYYVVNENDIDDFVANAQRVPGMGSDQQPDMSDFSQVALKDLNRYYGVSRHSPRFWEVHDQFNALYKVADPVEAGYLDLNRYENYPPPVRE